MPASLRRRGVAVTALALASGTTLAAFGTATPAVAAKPHAPAYYEGVTSANVLSVRLNLPSQLPALPGLPTNLAVNLMGANGDVVHNTLGTGKQTASTSVSALASGSLVDALPSALGLNKVLRVTLGQPAQHLTDIPINASPLLDVNVGTLAARATKSVNSSQAVLTDGTVAQLGQLLNLKAATGGATTLLSTLETQVNGVSGTVTDQVQSALDTVNGILGSDQVSQLTATAVSTLKQLQATLKTIEGKINGIIGNIGNTAVMSLHTLDASQSIAPADDAAKAVAQTTLADLDVLNGLITVKGFQSGATAIANGKTGGATAFVMDKKPIVQVGTPVLTATLDDTGINLSDVVGLPQEVTDQVNAALAQLQSALNDLLTTLGVHLNYVPGSVGRIAANGTHAEATGAEYQISIDNPLSALGAVTGNKAAVAAPLAVISLGHGTTASVSAQQKVPTHQNGVTPPAITTMPDTGANLPLIGGTGLALMLGAAYLRRRVRA